MIEKVLNSRMVYDGKLIKVRADTVSLPNGRIMTREVVEHPGAVAILPVLDVNKSARSIVMVRQYRHPTGKILLEIPAGTIKSGENPNDCAHRELSEETGFKAGKMVKMFQCFLAAGYSSELIHIFIATDLSKTETKLEPDEFIQIQTLEIEEAIKKIEKGEIEDAKAIAAILYAEQHHFLKI